ncbi:DNA replication complex GINS protein PSF1-like [Venturia canescens]|uniref:DNA replication complex GINS protein PSF1-like n=1 Tax=Venturia canescens TaxID=32260 RepID=UPI001C9D5292|nr:DNA replication complex GINS protein PSF1-like [Venturia canescens]
MFGKDAVKLIAELDLTEDIPPFNDRVVQQVLEEMQTLYTANAKDAQSMMAGDTSFYLLVPFRHIVLNRNKRCLLAYFYNRMRRLRQMRWEFGSILPPEVNANLLPEEIHWFNTYSDALATYMRSIGYADGLNLTTDIHPPRSLYIEVRCLVDYGRFELENGQVVNLKKDAHHLLPRSQCESLVRQGILEHIRS